MRIPTLVVDDQEDVRFLIRVLIDLANDGLFVVDEAANGPDALERLSESDPAVVVLDEMMPDMSGLEAAQIIRARRPGQVIVLCSAHLDREMVARAREMGIDHCIHKDDIQLLPGLLRAAFSG